MQKFLKDFEKGVKRERDRMDRPQKYLQGKIEYFTRNILLRLNDPDFHKKLDAIAGKMQVSGIREICPPSDSDLYDLNGTIYTGFGTINIRPLATGVEWFFWGGSSPVTPHFHHTTFFSKHPAFLPDSSPANSEGKLFFFMNTDKLIRFVSEKAQIWVARQNR